MSANPSDRRQQAAGQAPRARLHAALVRWPWTLIAITGTLAFAGCSAGRPGSAADGGDGSPSVGGQTNLGDDGATLPDDGDLSGAGGSPLPPEKEDPGNFRAPVVTG